MVRGPSPGPAPACPGPGQQLAAHPVQLADMAPPEAAQEGTQGGWRLDHAAEGAGGPAGAQRVGVVDAVAARQRGGHQSRNLIARIGSAWRIAEVEVPVNQLGQTQVQGQGGRKDQAGIGHQAAVVEGDLDPVGVVAWQHLLGAPCSGVGLLLQNHYPRGRGAPFCPLQEAAHTPSFGGLGLSGRSGYRPPSPRWLKLWRCSRPG